jgi:DNA-binding HxlR family transcriptional regulator
VWYGDDDPPSEPAGRPLLRWNELEKEACSIARITSIIGDRWTLLIVRECFLGVTRFDAFEERLGISKRILTERLQKLVQNFILVKVPYQQHPLRLGYQLTSKGRELYPILRTMQHWGDKHLSGKAGRPSVVVHSCGRPSDPVDRRTATCRLCPRASRSRVRLRSNAAVGRPSTDGHVAPTNGHPTSF